MPPLGSQGTQAPVEFADQNTIQTGATPVLDSTPPAPAGMPDTQTAPDAMNASSMQNNMLGNSPDALASPPATPGHTFGNEAPATTTLSDMGTQPDAINNDSATQTGPEVGANDRRKPAKDHYSTLPTAELLEDRSVIDEVLKERGESQGPNPVETSNNPM